MNQHKIHFYNSDFRGANKQFLKVSLVYDKNDQHNTIFDSYNIKLASTKIKSLKLKNALNSYSAFNEVKVNSEDSHDQFLLYSQFVAWNCDSCSVASLTDYEHNDVYKELLALQRITYTLVNWKDERETVVI